MGRDGRRRRLLIGCINRNKLYQQQEEDEHTEALNIEAIREKVWKPLGHQAEFGKHR